MSGGTAEQLLPYLYGSNWTFLSELSTRYCGPFSGCPFLIDITLEGSNGILIVLNGQIC